MKTWNYLRLFESRDNISEKYKRLHGREVSAGKANEIITNFSQARQYFFSANGADIIVKPLLLYYGMVSLARGVVLFASESSREASLKPSHGLETVDWQSVIQSGVQNLRVRTCNGLFLELLQATRNKSYHYANSSKVNHQVSYPEIAAGSEFSFSDILLMVPDLEDMYNRWSDDQVVFPEVTSIDTTSKPDTLIIKVGRVKDPSVIERCTQIPINVLSNKDGNIEFEVPKNVCLQIVQLFKGAFGIGDICLARAPAGSQCLSLTGIVHVMSFCMGMIARYFPTSWISLGRGEKGDKIYPLLLQVLDYIEEYGPKIYWDYLEGPYDFES